MAKMRKSTYAKKRFETIDPTGVCMFCSSGKALETITSVFTGCTGRGLSLRFKRPKRNKSARRVMDKWAYERGIELDFSRPGKPTDNAKVESFNGRLRQECLNAHWFLSLEDARRKIDDWRQYYNEVRPHSALQ